MTKTDSRQTRLLFICLGNICRSTAAQTIMEKMVKDEGLDDNFVIDSCGLGNWHVGQLADRRMRDAAYRRGYRLTHHARQIETGDFDRFDWLITMDDAVYRDVCRLAPTDEARQKVVGIDRYFLQYANRSDVPDPYYGGPADFTLAMDLIEDACKGLFKAWREGRL